MKLEELEVGTQYTLISTIGERVFYDCTIIAKKPEIDRVVISCPELMPIPYEVDPYWIEVRKND